MSRAFAGTLQPECLVDRPELAVPLVAEVSALIRKKQLRRREVEVALWQETVTEQVHDQAGGSDYLRLREAMESVQASYFAACRPLRLREPVAATLAESHERMRRLQSEFETTRARHAEAVRAACSASVRDYWAMRPARGLADTFFADAPFATAASRFARIHPVWWGGFFGRLQQTLAFGHPAEGELLDQLPRLRAAATKKTLAAVIEEWRAEHNDRWGWYGEVHYRMLSLRAGKKGCELVRWFDATAPGYLADSAVRVSLHADLTGRLREADPWSVPAPDSQSMLAWSEHGPN